MMRAVDDDFSAITPTGSAKLAGGLTVVSGIFSTIMALQGLLAVHGGYLLSVPIFGLLGLGGVSCGVGLLRMRGVATLAAAGFALAIGLVSFAWFFVMLFGLGALVLLPLLLTPLSGCAAIFALTCLKQARLADAARSRLRAQGLDSGL